MPERRFHAFFGWRSVFEQYYDKSPSGSPVSDGLGSCNVPLAGAKMDAEDWRNKPSTAGMTHNLCAINQFSVPDWGGAAGETRIILAYGETTILAKVSGAGYVLRVSVGAAGVDGTTVLTFGTLYGLSVQRQIAAPKRVRVWVNGVLEIDDSTLAGNPAVLSLEIGNTTNLGVGNLIFKAVAACLTDTDERMNETALSIVEMAITSGTPMHNDYTGQQPAGTPVDADRWDSVWEDPPDDDTTFLENPATANSTFRQTYHTTNVALANVQAIFVSQRGKATVANKNLDVYNIAGDGVNKVEVLGFQPATADYLDTQPAIYPTAPDGGVWSQADLDNLEIGPRWTIGADAVTWRQTAMHCEAVGVDYINLGPAADRRRLLAQVV